MDCGISGAVRASIYFIIPTIVTIVGVILMSIFYLPYDYYGAYSAIIWSRMIGPKVKILLFITIWVIIPLWIPIVAICVGVGAPLFYFTYCFFETYKNAFSNNTCCLMKTDVFVLMRNSLIDYQNFNQRAYGSIIFQLKNPHYNGHVYEISFFQIYFGGILCLIGMAVSAIVSTIITCLKCIPAIISIVVRFFKNCRDECCSHGCVCMCFPLLVIGFVLVVVGCIVSVPLIILFCVIYGGLNPIVEMYRANSLYVGITNGLKRICNDMYELDMSSNKLIFGTEFSCLYFCKFDMVESHVQPVFANHVDVQPVFANHVDVQPVFANHFDPQSNTTTDRLEKRISVEQIWENFFEMCTKCGRETLAEGFASKDDFESVDPYVIIGLTSLVIIRALERSRGTKSLILSDGIIINNLTRPTDMVSTRIYKEFISVLDQLDQLKLNDLELMFAEKWLFTCGNEEKTKSIRELITDSRISQIKVLTSRIQSIAINISSLPPYLRRFDQSIALVTRTNV